MEVRSERDVAVEAIAWRVDPTSTGELARQPSSADTQQGSSSVVSSVSSDSSNIPPGFITPAASRANAADLIRGRGALRPLAASAQTAGTAVSLGEPKRSGGVGSSLRRTLTKARHWRIFAHLPMWHVMQQLCSRSALLFT